MEIFAEDEINVSLASSELAVKQIIQNRILECPPSVPLYEVAERMSEAGCSSIIVTENGKPLGIWTEHDALAIDFSSPESLSLPVSAVMSFPLKTVNGEISL